MGSLFVQIAKCICLKVHNLFVSKYICPYVFTKDRATGHNFRRRQRRRLDWEVYLSKLQNVFVSNCTMYLYQNVFAFMFSTKVRATGHRVITSGGNYVGDWIGSGNGLKIETKRDNHKMTGTKKITISMITFSSRRDNSLF